jgi:hypothetical protein
MVTGMVLPYWAVSATAANRAGTSKPTPIFFTLRMVEA